MNGMLDKQGSQAAKSKIAVSVQASQHVQQRLFVRTYTRNSPCTTRILA